MHERVPSHRRRHRVATAAAALTLALTLALPSVARAQTCTLTAPATCSVNTSASMNIPAVVLVSVSPSPATQPVTLANYLAGYGDYAGPTVTVSANVAWALSISAATPLWSATNTVPGVVARADKPASDLHWSIDAATFTPLGVAGQQIAAGPRTSAAATALSWRVLYSLALDTPGDYAMTVLFTLTAP